MSMLLTPSAPAGPAHPQVQVLRDAATALCGLAADLAPVLDEVAAHHRPDVWEGGVASRFGDELDEHRRRLLHPVVGAATAMRDAAIALTARADALASLACEPAAPAC